MNKWIAEFDLEDGDTMPEHMDLEYKGAKIDFHCKPLEQEPCDDAVSRKEVQKEFVEWMNSSEDYYEHPVRFIRSLMSLPDVTTIRPKGHWIEQIDHEENCRTLICSNCDRPALHDGDSIWKHKFCPHCGADMREVEGEKNDPC